MRFRLLRRISLVFTIAVLLLAAVWIAGPALGITLPPLAFAAVVVVAIVVNIGLSFWTFRAMRTDAARVMAAHPGEVAFATTIISWPHLDRADRERAIVLVADRRGLCFRDHEDHEVQLVPADSVMTLELAPLEPRARFRPFRVTTIDGATIDFSGPSNPDQQVDAVVALRTALGRAAG